MTIEKSEVIMVRLSPRERKRLRDIARILRCGDSTAMRHLLNSAEVKPFVITFREAESLPDVEG
jgi:hypothetical protein